ncbi:CHAT domain-containing protein [Dapis sp. BLCC M229]|uniref:nSTAND1 domain-containing NTPase n=1 Tax=Dapis sp. BLCC M229 TaxID=3400188 RepID=UPI003CEA3FC7
MTNNSNPKTILILAANPKNTAPLRLDQEIREIDEGLHRANKRDKFQLQQKWAVRVRDFYRAILDYQPHIVHFCGHGAGQDGIVLEDDTGQMVLVQTDALASMFKLFAKKSVECVLLNACYSEVQAEAISQYVNYVIGMNKAVGDNAAVAFAVAFYDALAADYEVEEAYELGCSQMMSYLEDKTPILKKKHLTDTSINDENLITEDDVIPPNPYQGLSAFQEEDSDFFFGQEKFVNKLVEVTHKQPLIAVVGPSGSGKSSVVYAGLVPQLRTEKKWLIESFLPGKEPFLSLAFVLVGQLEPEAGETQKLREATGLARDMQEGRITLSQVVNRILERNHGQQLLLIADQFEELYTLCREKEKQERFAEVLLTAIREENVKLILTLRADFYGYVLSYRPFRDALQEYTPQLLSSMKREELQQAIELPAQKSEVQLEAKLTERILDDVGEEPGNLPLLEFALTRLWSKQENRVLTHHAYEEIGGVKKAIANHAEQIFQQLKETEKKQAERIFLQLVRPGEGTEDTRRVATRGEVGEDNWNLVSYLAGYQARLVVTGRREEEDTVEVVHEALIREWGTLQGWIDANREFRTWQERLKVTLREWKKNNNDLGGLLRGVRLSVAEDWLRKRGGEMTEEERNFIQVSFKERDREKKERERRRQLTIIGLSAFSFIALSLAGIAGWQWQNSIKSEIQALSASSKALFTSNRYSFDPLIGALRAGKKLKNSIWWRNDAKLKLEVMEALSAIYWVRESNRLENHQGFVQQVKYSPDDQTIATASFDNTAKLWSTDGKELVTLEGHTADVVDVSFSPDGQTIATASRDKTVRLWNKQGELLNTFNAHENVVWSVSFSPDGKTIATASADQIAKLWTLDGVLLKDLKGHKGEIFRISFSPDGETIATASADNTVKLWDIQGNLLDTFTRHTDKVMSVSFSPDGQTIASAGKDKRLILWNKKTKEPVFPPVNNKDSVAITYVSFSPDGQTIATAYQDGKVQLRRSKDGLLLETLEGHKDRVNSVNFSRDGKTLISAGNDRKVKIWPSNDLLTHFVGHKSEVYGIDISPKNNILVTASADKTVKLWNLHGQELQTFQGHDEAVLKAHFSSDSKKIASNGYGKTIKLWNLQGQELQTLTGHNDSVVNLAFSPDGEIIASSSRDQTVKLWNLQGQELETLTGHKNAVMDVSFSPDGKKIASVDQDGYLKLWNSDGNSLDSWEAHNPFSAYSIRFSPDGQVIATAGEDQTVKLWNLDGVLLSSPLDFNGHTAAIGGMDFNPYQEIIATASDDGTIRVWKLNGTLITPLLGHNQAVSSVKFSPDGKMLASASSDKIALLWNVENLTLDGFIKYGCNWLSDYLKNNPNAPKDICNDI